MNDARTNGGGPGERCGLCARVLEEVEGRIEKVLRTIDDRDPVLLDVGCWDGEFTMRCASQLGASRVLGVEVYEEPRRGPPSPAGSRWRASTSRPSRFPWPDESVDVVVCNQVLEHLKNIWLPMSEMHRVLRARRSRHPLGPEPGQPPQPRPARASAASRPRSGSSALTFAATRWSEFSALVERGGAYSIESRRGAGFYPLPSPWSAPLSALWKGASHTIVLLARKVLRAGCWSHIPRRAADADLLRRRPSDS